MPLSYHVIPYNSMDEFIEILKEREIIDERGAQNRHFKYLETYFEKIDVHTVIIEPEYIDRDYLEDYSRYYSKCFQKYHKWCSRLHFFSIAFSEADFRQHVVSYNVHENNDFLQKAYLGFIVLRPLPKTLFGRTCLVTYPDDAGGKCRVFPVIREYKTHILGIELTVHTLAFQEQDNAVSACATAALWSALHGTEQGNVHHVSSPYEITFNAKKLISDYSKNTFPNKGLLPSQMAHAIREEGLEPLLAGFVNTSYLKALLRAYLHVRVPVVLGVTLRYEEEEGELPNGRLRKLPIGDHAITVTGYHLNNEEAKEFDVKLIPTKIEKDSVRPMFLYSSKIEQIYVHDDQLGPFACMKFRDEYWQHLETGWYKYSDKLDKVNATVSTILFPLYHKIRIRFNTIFSIIRDFQTYYMDMWDKMGCAVIWDIYLSTVCDLKEHILLMDNTILADEESRMSMLSYKMPRYVWVVDAYVKYGENKENLTFSFYFDATDIDNSDLFICALHYDKISYLVTAIQAELSRGNDIMHDDSPYNYQSGKILSHYLHDDSSQIIKPLDSYRSMQEVYDKIKALDALRKEGIKA